MQEVKIHMTTDILTDSDLDISQLVDKPWVTIVWDDPVNLMSYVTFVFIKLFGFTHEHAQELMLQVHNEGRAAVAVGSREEMELAVQRLHEHGLWATLQRDEKF